MNIRKVTIKNFKCYKETFELNLGPGINIIVGNNEEGKSTIVEAIHLALSGFYCGKYLRNELSEYLFNIDTIREFKKNPAVPPEILIELYFDGLGLAIYEGDGNSERKKNTGISVKVCVNEKDIELYNDYIRNCGESISLPIEYYEITWSTFAREVTSVKHLPIKSALIDSANNKLQNGTDLYINHIIKTQLEAKERNDLAQSHRKLQGKFMEEESVKAINLKIVGLTKSFAENVELKLSVDLSSKNAWENSMISYIEEIPFYHIGKGFQAIIKTKLALEHKKAEEANIILIEEPENHLSHSKLNQLIKDIEKKCLAGENKKQVVITTHSSFVANKLGLNNLILLNSKKQITFKQLNTDTINYFQKISGYDTLRLILCKSAILCEGPSDELIIQKKYLIAHNKLPIENGIEVISVGLSFSRYIEIAELVSKKISIVTDNDGKVNDLRERYAKYLPGLHRTIAIYFDFDNAFPTLEPQLFKVNNFKVLNEIIDEKYKINGNGYKKGEYKCNNNEELLKFMTDNKTEYALKLFDTDLKYNFPKYIEDAIQFIQEE